MAGIGVGLCVLSTHPLRGYDGDIHQQLTFIAARQFNDCVQRRTDVSRLSALDSRYIVKANVALADGGIFGRMFRWPYYNRDDQTGQSTWGVFETRFHDHFDAQLAILAESPKREQRLRALGRVVSYVQDVTSPAHVVPVYTGRWWRLSLGDRFDKYPVDIERVREGALTSCDYVLQNGADFPQVLAEAATETLAAVQSPIMGYPTTWESFWRLAESAREFGEYGRAGNTFGDRTEFRCGEKVNGVRERCLLLDDDPIYKDFAYHRHLTAVIATMRTLMLFQQGADQPVEPRNAVEMTQK